MFASAHHSSNVNYPTKQREHSHMIELKSSSAIRADRELRRERWMAVGVLFLFVALIAVLLTIAVFGGSSMNMDTGYEYWMMP